MAAGHNLLGRFPRNTFRYVNFNGLAAAGGGSPTGGLVGSPITVFNNVNAGGVNGVVRILRLTIFCLTSLVGASATIALGVAGNTGYLIPATTGTGILQGYFWANTTPTLGAGTILSNFNLYGPLILTIATANITAGQLQFDCAWEPAGPIGNLT